MIQVIEACASCSRWPGGAAGAERPTWRPLDPRGCEHVGRSCCCEADVHVLFHFHSLTFLLPHEVSGRPPDSAGLEASWWLHLPLVSSLASPTASQTPG